MKIDMNITRISDALLLNQTEYLVQQERETTVMILRHLREIEVRRLYIELGYSSMHKYCIQKLKYSEGQAYRRLTSARLMTELPEIELQIQAGDLNLTNLSKIQSYVRSEKAANCELDKKEKLELIARMENKSTREVEHELVKKSHQPLLMAEKFKMTEQELSQVLSDSSQSGINYQQFQTLLATEQQQLLQEFKNLYAHELNDLSNHSVLIFLLEKAVHHKKKKLGLLEKSDNASLPSAPKVAGPNATKRKPIKLAVKRTLWSRAEGCCEHIDPKTSKRCCEKFALEEDHVQPFALGGSDDLDNLQLLCRAHNSRRAIKTFGVFRAARASH